MVRGIHSNCHGEFMNCDGTYRIALRVYDGPDCLYCVMGEDGKVQDYAALRSESRPEVLPFFKRCALCCGVG